MELFEIVQVTETSRLTEVNKLLDAGWILLSTGFCTSDVPGYDHHSYSLGLPKGVPHIEEPKNKYPDGLNF